MPDCDPVVTNPSSLEETLRVAVALQMAGNAAQAEPLYRAILEREPTHDEASYCLGMALVQLHRPSEAITPLSAALHARADNLDYWLGYLEALMLTGDLEAAARDLELARQRGLAGKAADEFATRLAATRDAEAAVLQLVQAQRFAEALPLARNLTECHARHGPGWKIYAAMLWATGAFDAALTAMRMSTRLMPGDAEAFSNLGSALNKVQQLDEAESSLQQALAIEPTFAAAHANLGANYQMQGRYADAETHFRHALAPGASRPLSDPGAIASNRLFMLNHDPRLDIAMLFEEHRRVGSQFEAGIAAPPGHRHTRDPDRPLQVGMVSADLRSHAVPCFLMPVLQEWAKRDTLRITAYHAYPTQDEISRRLRGLVARWVPVAGLSDAELAGCIASDGIDILIDLSGHTAMNRLRAFAHRPAPIQVSWLGYPATTGLRSMDYYLTDRHFSPQGQFDAYYTEKLAFVPTVWPFEPAATAPPVNGLPASVTGTLSFGSFNRIAKINQPTVGLWAQLLAALPRTTLMIAGVPLGQQHRRVIEWFEAAGIGPDRLAFHPWTNLEALLELHQRVDIALEPLPYTGCTTSNQALWMGVPTLTLAGTTPASRLCAANLGHLELDEFIASDAADFIARGVHWAGRLPDLAALRSGLRTRWTTSPARDSRRVAVGIERALRHMWRQWCAGLPAETFEIISTDLE